ncbi:hypothetical protein C8Q80DRAFT_1117099 [Daedaleopsis nitida]|nr:hypothetical protein C8Q80DRAFT_1117099 [Daedaleopsis nitida]
MPILNLPTLPQVTASQPTRPVHPTAPLRSLPALPMQGPSDADQEANHENASLEEEDEEDGDDGADGAGQEDGSDESDDGEDVISPSQTASVVGPSRLPPLPNVDISGFSVSFRDVGLHPNTPQAHSQAGSSVDYFSSKLPDPPFSPMRTPRASDVRQHVKTRPVVPQPRLMPMPATPETPRPGLYHHASKSMIDITSVGKDKDKIVSPKLGRTPSRKLEALAGQAGTAEAQTTEGAEHAESAEDVITAPMIRRRRSLPVYEPSSDPPPYPDPLFRRKGQALYQPQPREDEGRESLPSYTNTIYLSGPMPRKMEFTQPGVQAKDRKWRRVWCVLEGTAFRVYKCPPAASGVSAIEQWWEKRVGVGDITSVNVTAITASGIRVSAIRERQREAENGRIPKIAEESMQESSPRPSQEASSSGEPSPPSPSTKSVLGLTSRFLRRQRSKSMNRLRSDSNSSTSRLSVDSRQEIARNSAGIASRHSMDTLGSSRPSNVSSATSQATHSTTLTVPSPTSTSPNSSGDSSSSHFSRTRFRQHSSGLSEQKCADDKEKKPTYTPDPKDLIHQYTLQNAESGLASDYQKRKNVIRVRMEGEQFLLQAKDVAAVIDWIEGIQMGTNVALDIDQRPMPRGPIFPRRRRRRPRRAEAAAATAAASTSNAESTAAPNAP